MDEYELLAHLDAEADRRAASVRALLIEQGRSDLAAELDERLRAVRNGTSEARSCWHSISTAQRRVLLLLGAGRALVRSPGSRTLYDAIGGTADAVRGAAGVRTVRALAAHDLVAWEGGAFDPERRAALTERGRFVLTHGRDIG